MLRASVARNAPIAPQVEPALVDAFSAAGEPEERERRKEVRVPFAKGTRHTLRRFTENLEVPNDGAQSTRLQQVDRRF